MTQVEATDLREHNQKDDESMVKLTAMIVVITIIAVMKRDAAATERTTKYDGSKGQLLFKGNTITYRIIFYTVERKEENWGSGDKWLGMMKTQLARPK